MQNKVKIEILGSTYTISTNESEEYVKELGVKLNDAIAAVMKNNDALSVTAALMLVALDYLDSLKKSEENADNIRSQLTEYMNDSGKSLGELSFLKRENEKLRKRLEGKKDVG